MSESSDDPITNAKFKHFIPTQDGGLWLFCNRPIEEAATDMLRSAIRASKPRALLGKKSVPAQSLAPAPV